MSIRKYLAATAFAGAIVLASPASAAVTYSLTENGQSMFHFSADAPDFYTSNVTLDTTALGSYSTNFSKVEFCFANTKCNLAGLQSSIYDTINVQGTAVGQSFFFNSGTFTQFGLFQTKAFAVVAGGSASLLISAGSVAPAVPEPATWAMMLVGFGMVAGAARYRRTVKVSLT